MAADRRTNVRLTLLRILFSTLERVSPVAGGAVAARLFCTAPRYPAPAREREILAGAEAFRVRVGRRHIQAWRWGRGPVVLLMHGWGGRGAQLGSFVAPLLAAGFSVLTLDAPGHGLSGGGMTALPLFVDTLLALQTELGTVRAVIGHSMGAGAVAMALQRGLALDAAVFVGPPRALVGYYEDFVATLALGARTQAAMRASVERRFDVRLADVDIALLAPQQRTPLLVLHDADDREVPLAHGREVATLWPNAELVASSGLGHRRILRDPESVARAVAFVSARVSARCRNAACATPLDCTWDTDAGLCPDCTLSAELFDPLARALSATL